jgi:hypothetical protein
MGLILLIIVVVLLFGGGGGYYAHRSFGGARPATVTFDRAIRDVTEYNVTDPSSGGPLKVVQEATGPLTVVTSLLDAGVRILVITP